MKTTHQLHIQNYPMTLFSTVIYSAVNYFQIIRETPDFRQYLPVSRLEYDISQIIAEVCHFFDFWQ